MKNLLPRFSIVVAFFIGLSNTGFAEASTDACQINEDKLNQSKIGLVLCVGGARGAAYICFLKALE